MGRVQEPREGVCGGCSSKGGKRVDTPGVKHEIEEGYEVELTGNEAKAYRRQAALLNFIAQYRVDVVLCAQGASTTMSRPVVGGHTSLKRASKYFVGDPVCVYKYTWHGRQTDLI